MKMIKPLTKKALSARLFGLRPDLKTGDVVEYVVTTKIGISTHVEGLFVIKSISGQTALVGPIDGSGEEFVCFVFWLQKNQFMTDAMAALESQC